MPSLSFRVATALASFVTLAAAAPDLRAQVPVQLRCEVTDGSAAGCYYCPGFGHVVKFVGTPLVSGTINLAGYHNQYVRIQGTWNGSAVTVNSIQVTTDSFSLSGNTSIGHRLRSNSMGNPGELALNVVALGTAFSVPFLDLAFQLDPATSVVQGLGVVNGNGEFKSDLDIPNDPSLVGLRLTGQGAILDAAGSLLTTNVDSKVVTP
ncbi:MAG: hypothetical protein H6838_16675 [Planctomycetes bacterium]|nr:hypothetical protein [Planctomycetota bacterium]MCB9887129.1 hypothetical protein [Planctomycetota bacterium]